MVRQKIPKREDNIAFINRIMSFGCPTGPLIQPFIIVALEKYAESVAAADAADMDSAVLSGEAWKATGEWLNAEIKARFAKAGL